MTHKPNKPDTDISEIHHSPAVIADVWWQLKAAEPQRVETVEEHLGNALSVIRMARQAGRLLEDEDAATIRRRLAAAMRELERGNL